MKKLKWFRMVIFALCAIADNYITMKDSIKKRRRGLNLTKLEEQLDQALESETKESLNEWLRIKVCKWSWHQWKYNFVHNPSKRTCKRCGLTQKVFFKQGVHPSEMEQWK